MTLGAFAEGSLTLSATDPSVLIQTFADAVSPAGTWTRHQGEAAFTHATGRYEVGWEAAPKTSSASAGNLLDDIQADLAPLVEIASATPSAVDPDAPLLPLRLRLTGRLITDGILKIALAATELEPEQNRLGDVLGVPGAEATIDDQGVITITVPPGVYGEGGRSSALTLPIDLGGQTVRALELRLSAAGGDNGSDLPLRTGPAESCWVPGPSNGPSRSRHDRRTCN